MAKYKDVDRLMAILEYRCNEADNVEAWLAFAMACEDVRDLPDADVVEVIRCKDCIHYMPYDWMFSEVRKSDNIEDYPQDEIGCEWIDHHINPEGYCSYGERKDG